jgi:hypothetical protein
MRFTIFLITITLFTFTAIINAQSETKITADDAARSDFFGYSVSISGDYVVIGARLDDDGCNHSGSAYIFIREGDGWTEQAKLTADDAARSDFFGCSVSINGDYAVFGANNDIGEDEGSAYIFVRDGANWTQQAKLTANDADAVDEFGKSVSINGDYAVVGAMGNFLDGEDEGSAYIFVRNGADWTQQAKLTAEDAAAGDEFGCSVSISGDYAVIGACGDDDDGSCSGSAYIFARDGEDWVQQAKLTANDAEAVDYFGCSVSISEDHAVIGALYDDDGGDKSGSVYIFVREDDNWTQLAKLTAEDAAAGDEFGCSVSISGDYAVIGACGDDDDGWSSGSAYIYNLGENNIEWHSNMADIPVDYGIISAYPNPFNSAIRIGFNLKSAHEVVIQALDLQGRTIAEIYQGYYQAGQHQITWDAQTFQSGLYFVRLEAAGLMATRKVILIR